MHLVGLPQLLQRLLSVCDGGLQQVLHAPGTTGSDVHRCRRPRPRLRAYWGQLLVYRPYGLVQLGPKTSLQLLLISRPQAPAAAANALRHTPNGAERAPQRRQQLTPRALPPPAAAPSFKPAMGSTNNAAPLASAGPRSCMRW